MALGYLNTGSLTSNNNITRAKKLAYIYIRSNTDASGRVTDPQVYQNAINSYLSPYVDNLDVRKTIGSYKNKIKSLSVSENNNESVVNFFKNQVSNSIKLVNNSDFKNLGETVQQISSNLDTTLVALDNVIKSSQNKNINSLIKYREYLKGFALAERQLVRGFINGSPNVNTYGLYIKTNPVNNSIISGTVIPTSYAKDFGFDNSKRIDMPQKIGDVQFPIYLPTYKNSDGENVAKLGDNTWSGTGAFSLTHDSGTMPTDTGFDISSDVQFPIQPFNLAKGQFAKSIINSQGDENYYWKGNDGKVRVINPQEMNNIKNDPTMSNEIQRAVPIGYDNIKNLGTLEPFTSSDIQNVPSITQQSQVENKPSFFSKASSIVTSNPLINPFENPVNKLIGGAVSAISGFFGRKNRQSPPKKAQVSSGGKYSTSDVISSGKQFFNKPQ